jgi:small subunit ribosomal protein S11
MKMLFKLMVTNNQDRKAREDRAGIDMEKVSSDGFLLTSQKERHEEPHHFHVYATRHNTHITVTTPNRDPIISKSAGDIGFRKSARKHYDSAFQLASYVMGRLQESGKNREISKLEVVLRGFGQGREAVTKALLGSEGRFLRGKIIRVADATRLKFGGTRSKKPRRLG